ncbi:DUF4270 family protein [Arcticibacterium luteifluviistationis]|uniref:DUF4270 domain-containing protein n=1 Tax=Arcticibacterium luteifluviistationis TaxID=1784714 RepID=A0A2Z4GA95_9BACT|nr:DUF4270 family protein [Arcticibacterium luteifluviistationis]AWV98074.1 hypothetical protein DJ013_07765 [Arcticibacterium luteifluviistationis]
MKNIIAILMAIGGLTMSCTEGSLDINLDVNSEINQNTVRIDTMRLEGFTVKEDSTYTSASGLLQVGSYTMNSKLDVSSEAYFQVSLPVTNYGAYNITETMVLDSAKIQLRLYGNIGDTTAYQTIRLHELLSEIPTSDGQLSNSSYPYEENYIAEKIWKIRPGRDTLVELTLNTATAQKIWEYYQTSYREDNPSLLKIIKGLLLKGGQNNTSISVFNATNADIRLYTHTQNTYIQYAFDFPLIVNNAQFNHYTYSSDFDKLNTLAPDEQVNASLMNNEFVLNSGLGLSGKIEIPGISQLKEITDLSGIHQVQMVLYSTRKSATESPTPPASLALYTINLNNEIEAAMSDAYGTQITGVYVYNPEDLVFTSYYTFDLTQYFKNILFYGIQNKGFKVLPADDGTVNGTFGGVYLGNSDNASFKAKLIVYYGQ